MDRKRIQKFIDAVNSYYSFALLLYAAVLYIAAHNAVFWWVLIALTPILSGWTGYLIHSYVALRGVRYGFRLLSDIMSYEVKLNDHYVLRYTTTLKAASNHLLSYPIGYQWSGATDGIVPEVITDGQKLLGVIEKYDKKTKTARVSSYQELVPSKGEWRYWFVGLAQPAYRNDIVEIKYKQEFFDKRKIAKPCLYYVVNSPMRKLELNVKFSGKQPRTVYCSYIKPSDPRHAYLGKGLQYDPEKQWATWKVTHPKKGYCYRIQWQ